MKTNTEELAENVCLHAKLIDARSEPVTEGGTG